MSTKEVFGLPNSDLVPGIYEGVEQSSSFTFLDLMFWFTFPDRDDSILRMLLNDSTMVMIAFSFVFIFGSLGGLKLWEGSLDLVKALRTEVRNGHLSFKGKQVLEVGS